MKVDRVTSGSNISGTTAVFGLVNHSRRINLCSCAVVQGLQKCVAGLPMAGLREEVGQEAEGN